MDTAVRRSPGEQGQVTVMTIGFLLFIGLLAVVVINSSAAFLERQRLDNIADGAALAAADGLSRETFYGEGEVTLDDRQARQLIDDYVTESAIRVVAVRTDDDTV
ncbi:MAG: pilus assembly protein TadG-related protein, partial [Aeromicrobium sp.]